MSNRDLIIYYNMRQLVQVATRVTVNTSTLLDVISSTNHESHTVTGVYKTGMSDHYMIYTVYDNAYTDHGHQKLQEVSY